MRQFLKFTLAILASLAVASAACLGAEPSEKRLALVIGNAAYLTGTLMTPANDAGLIAQSLQAAGFDVIGARDLDEDSLRHAFWDFVDKASKAGPDTVVAVYFAGYGLQLEGENYLLPIDAYIAGDSDVPVRTLRLSDYTRAFAALRLKATIVVLDAARAIPFSGGRQPLASGLAWVETEPGMLIAFNATPGTVAPEGHEGYGPYAKALFEMIREGGLSPANVFDRVRLRVNESTKGAQVPWDASQIETQFNFFERGPGAPPRADSPEQAAWMRSQPMRNLGAPDAYLVALSRDTLDGYGDFLADHWHDPLAKRVRAILAARREAITWRRTYQVNTPEAYWSYLTRYRRGPHAADARRLLMRLAAAIEPPPRFAMMEYDVPSPRPGESEYFERPVLTFDDPEFAAPTPPPPLYFLEPTPPEFVALGPPLPPRAAYTLPMPAFVPLPDYIGVPANVVAPSNPVIFNNIHSTLVVNYTANVVTITEPGGQVVSSAPGDASAPPIGPALPPSVALKAALIDSQNPAAPAPNQETTGAIALRPIQPLPTMAPAPPSGNQPPANPPVATLSTPATDSEPPRNPSVATFPPPATGKISLPIPRTATLSPPATDNIPLPIPRRRATLPPPSATDDIPLPIPRAAMLSPPGIGHSSQRAPQAPLVRQVQAPWPSPRAAPQGAVGSPLPSTAATKCQVMNGKQTCK